MKWILVYAIDSKIVVNHCELAENTRPLFDGSLYAMIEFDTETEMLAYIAANNLVEATNEID